ncbi:diguanylate cyclase [Burkholderia vietnamiensis]|uniref:sensor domain-containing diguanylate cyclase n=1 Tax=Burkholderia vietnamiensis TaxID=60552 RepID=UPI000841D3C2|nr:diguanylate cyclase [Burkholderia vietnamiensis]AOK02370.1 diguanylate cyclase [Burkholderia vietnamiensis]AOK44847.1 diguanylate cyclase [Burkholderia vietnamiensis]
MLTTDSDDDAVASAGSAAGEVSPLLASPECEAVTRLARAHFGVVTALVTLSAPEGQRLQAVDGVFPHAIPPDLFAKRINVEKESEKVVVVPDTHDDSRFFFEDRGVTAKLPRFFAACALTASDGRHLGALCLLDDAFRTLDEGQRAFLHELATIAAQSVARGQVEAELRGRAAELQAEKDLITLALIGSGTGVWDRDVTTGEIRYSPEWKAILGYESHEISNRIEDAYLRLHPDEREYVKETMQAHFENRTDRYEIEHRIRCKDGTYKWICSRGKVVSRNGDGRALRMVGTTTDITGLRDMATQLQETISLITNLTNEVPGLVFQYRQTADGRGVFAYASDGVRQIYEVTPEQVVRSADVVEARIDPRDVAGYRQSLLESAVNLTPWRFEYRVRLPQQGIRWRQSDARPQRMADGSTLWHGFVTDTTERKRIEAELHELATVDHLTQLANRRHFMTQGEAELVRIRRAESRIAAVLMLDLDNFKALNDRWGHALGDRALRHFAGLLRSEARAGDIVGRIGGEEFAAVLPDSGTEEAIAFGLRVQRRAAETPLVLGEQHVALTVSIGVDRMYATDVGVDQALTRCDKALYLAKERGRNRVELYRE